MINLNCLIKDSRVWVRRWPKFQGQVWAATCDAPTCDQARLFSNWRTFTTPWAKTRGSRDSGNTRDTPTRFWTPSKRRPRVVSGRSWRRSWTKCWRETSWRGTTLRPGLIKLFAILIILRAPLTRSWDPCSLYDTPPNVWLAINLPRKTSKK